MAVRKEKTGKDQYDIIIDGWENGIGSSPHKGIANMQGVNISTEPGEVMCSYARKMISQQSISNGTLTATNSSAQFGYSGTTPLNPGTWIRVTSVTNSCISTGYYYVMAESTPTIIFLNTAYKGISTGGETAATANGTATFSVNSFNGNALAQITAATYEDLGNNNYNYYFLEKGNGSFAQIWMIISAQGTNAMYGLINPGTPSNAFTNATGLAIFPGVYQEVVMSSTSNPIFNKSNSFLVVTGDASTLGACGIASTQNIDLGTWAGFTSFPLFAPGTVGVPHSLLYGQDNVMYQLDAQNLLSLQPAFANTGFIFTADGSTANLTVKTSTNGAGPVLGMPTVFTSSGTLPSPFVQGNVYYVVAVASSGSATTFQVSATVNGSAISSSTTGSGNQYFTSVYFQPTAGSIGGYSVLAIPASYIANPQALELEVNEVGQCLGELGVNLAIGVKTNKLYFWSRQPVIGSNGALINSFPYPVLLRENDVKLLITADNMLLIGAGHKGNVYETSGSAAEFLIKIPDYPSGQVEPYYTWMAGMYSRGKAYLAPQQGSGTNNIGGNWSFVPSPGQYPGLEVGTTLSLETQNSYGTWGGYTTVLLQIPNQAAQGTQYYTGWADGNGNFGVDASATTPIITGAVIETDLLQIGITYEKKTFSQIEYILATPFATGESIQINYRTSLSDTWHSLGTPSTETGGLSGVYAVNFQQVVLLQLQVILTSTNTNPSFCRLLQIRIR